MGILLEKRTSTLSPHAHFIFKPIIDLKAKFKDIKCLQGIYVKQIKETFYEQNIKLLTY